ncbi:hypothetical protein CTRI78_v002142 [Colletotrichum trifolii]|uniref:Uncharacterized protein n=1 Tax=Colletotrichum trifolii TaxID=5466 RepID=A0A4R8RMM9_COLTR|nr:hypothetical protein CTRI78_v002142 [Colletotrichum trifolii]
MPPYEGLGLTNPVSQQVAEVAKSFSQVSALYVINSASPVCPRLSPSTTCCRLLSLSGSRPGPPDGGRGREDRHESPVPCIFGT